MSKKLLITPILAVAFAGTLATAPPVNAEKLNIGGTDYWTIDEVEKTGQKYIEDLKMCEGRRECEEYLDTAYILAENEYSAGQAFMDNFFIITAINPAESTIRVVFHDEANRRMMMPGEDMGKDVMQNLFLYWWDGDQSRWIYAFENPEYEINRQDIFVHIGEPGENWLTPNKEVELKVPDFDFSHLKTSRIFFYAVSEKSNAAGDRDITECMNAIESLDGYECQAVFDWLGNINYQPLKAKAKISTSNIEVPTTPVINNTEVISTSTIRVPENMAKTTSSGTEVVLATTDTTATADMATDTISVDIAPDTTASTPDNTVEVPLVAGKGKEHQFPWWLVVFIFSGIFLVLWWFIPLPKRKKDEKSLDK